MKFSQMFIKTTKEAPANATLKSHIFLTQAGFIHQIGSGLYNLMPLGKIVFDKVSQIVKQELKKAGAQEILLSFVTPADLWKDSGRYHRYGKELLRFLDRKDNEFVLGPTHEEAVVDLVRSRAKSYKDLPISLFQLAVKFRDEHRPRFGLLRAREFTMKDGYSFHSSFEDLEREFNNMKQAYESSFSKMGLDFRVVDADSGAIGGGGSKEFMLLANSGEDDIAICSSCQYAANIETAKRTPKTHANTLKEGEFYTPNAKTIDQLCEFLKVGAQQTAKAVIKKAIFNETCELVCFFVNGSDTLEETKALNACGANELVDPSSDELSAFAIGFVGFGANIKTYYDKELNPQNIYLSGANKKDYHIASYLPKDANFADLIAVQEGDLCPNCQAKINIKKGIEIGHIFKLGDKYSKALNATFLDENAKAKPFIMGCYGIGISRIIAAAIEQNHDEKGMIWTKELAPFKVDIIIENIKNQDQVALANKLYEILQEKNVEVILDDRKERFGFKMNDFELIGFPFAIIVGKNAGQNLVELVERKTLKRQDLSIEEVVKKCLI